MDRIKELQSKIEKYHGIGDKEQEYSNIYILCDEYYKQGNIPELHDALKMRLKLALEMDDKRLQIDSYAALMNLSAMYLDDNTGAIKYAKLAHKLASEAKMDYFTDHYKSYIKFLQKGSKNPVGDLVLEENLKIMDDIKTKRKT